VLQALDRRGGQYAGPAGHRGQAVQGPVQSQAEQLLLARHVVVDGRLGDAEPDREVAHAGPVVAARIEQFDAHRQHRGAAVTRPPCAMAGPFTMSRRTVMRVTARPSSWSISSMPSPREASSFAIIVSTLGTPGIAIRLLYY